MTSALLQRFRLAKLASQIGVATFAAVLTTITAIGCSSGPPPQLTADQRQSIESAFVTQRLPSPQSLEINESGYLVATFEIDDAALTRMMAAGISTPREFASKAVITLRNAELPLNLVDKYRVTMNGPSPGPGLTTRYGSARFSEGSSVSWEPGLPR